MATRRSHSRTRSSARSAPGCRSTRESGASAEERAVDHLRRQGYRILARNLRLGIGELDIVALDGEVLAFVEVRSRSRADRGSALETVDAAKQRRLVRLASLYLARHRQPGRVCRFDVVGITAGDIVLVRDAFRAG
jgi:putative endonuclease